MKVVEVTRIPDPGMLTVDPVVNPVPVMLRFSVEPCTPAVGKTPVRTAALCAKAEPQNKNARMIGARMSGVE